MSILDVWFCVCENNDTNLTGSCFDSSGSSSVDIWYLYSATTDSTDIGYMSRSDIINDTDNVIEQFSFIIPSITNTNVNRFGVQINVELALISGLRRRMRARVLSKNRVLIMIN